MPCLCRLPRRCLLPLRPRYVARIYRLWPPQYGVARTASGMPAPPSGTITSSCSFTAYRNGKDRRPQNAAHTSTGTWRQFQPHIRSTAPKDAHSSGQGRNTFVRCNGAGVCGMGRGGCGVAAALLGYTARSCRWQRRARLSIRNRRLFSPTLLLLLRPCMRIIPFNKHACK
jgi:hypothetical protein